MKLAKLMKKLGGLCFLFMWLPFGIFMYKASTSGMKRTMNFEELTAPEFFMDAGIWLALLMTFIILATILTIGSLIVGAISNKRVLTNGQDAEAKILALNDTGTRINNNPVVQFSLEVHPNNQPAFVAVASQTVSVIHLPSFQPGKLVNVKYVPGTDKVAIIGAKVS